ncbi:MAG: hypothetical protein JEZ14_20960 [Marinilabiliaceae bacterium]|nr:hypothetical protein [Marinilabiliaceae bacterium]
MNKRSSNIGLGLAGVLSLVLMVTLSLDAGISGDEYVHLRQSEFVIDYYTSLGENQAALHTPVTNLKYYGQGFDNFTTLLARVFNVEDIFTLRHVSNAVAGWLVVVFTFLIGRLLGGTWTGMAAALFVLASPRFLGHSFNNLKDIPFALGYTMSAFFLIKWLKEWPRQTSIVRTGLIFAIAFTLSIRPAGLLIICYLWLVSGVQFLLWKRKDAAALIRLIKRLVAISIAGYFLGLLFWPYALENPFWHPIKSLLVMSDYPVTIRQLFEGKLQWSDQLPWYYIYKYMMITIPIPVLVLFFKTPLLFAIRRKDYQVKKLIFFILFLIFFPLIYATFRQSNLYGGCRHFLFIYPLMAVMAAVVFTGIIKSIKRIYLKIIFILLIAILFYQPVSFTLKNHPLQYVYFNAFAGGVKGAYGVYETDYYYHSLRKASEELQALSLSDAQDTLIIASNFDTKWYFKDYHRPTKHIYTPYYSRGDKDWDYGIFVNAYMYPFPLNNHLWPPANTMFTVDVNEVPVCAVVRRIDKTYFLAYKAFLMKDMDEAIDLYVQALKDEPGNESAYVNLGLAYLQTDRAKLAREVFYQCLQVMPDYEPAKYYLSKTLRELGCPTEAMNELKELIVLNPKYLKAYLELSELFQDMNQSQNAIDILNQSLIIQPGFSEAKNRIDQLLSNTN